MIVYGIKQELNNSLDVFAKLLQLLDDDELTRFKRYQNNSSAMQFLVGRLLLRYMLSKHYQLSYHSINIVYNDYGKPTLSANDIYFNIAHSGKWVVCAIADSPVGIDIEKINKWRPIVARRLFSADEYKVLLTHKGRARDDYFYTLWTLKESYSKAIGRGLTLPFNALNIKKSQLNQLFVTDDNYLLKQYNVDNEYKMAVCTANDNFADDVKIIDIANIYECLLND